MTLKVPLLLKIHFLIFTWRMTIVDIDDAKKLSPCFTFNLSLARLCMSMISSFETHNPIDAIT